MPAAVGLARLHGRSPTGALRATRPARRQVSTMVLGTSAVPTYPTGPGSTPRATAQVIFPAIAAGTRTALQGHRRPAPTAVIRAPVTPTGVPTQRAGPVPTPEIGTTGPPATSPRGTTNVTQVLATTVRQQIGARPGVAKTPGITAIGSEQALPAHPVLLALNVLEGGEAATAVLDGVAATTAARA